MSTTTATSEPPAWQTVAQEYRAAAAAKIPQEWKLDSKWTNDINPNSTQNVLDIPRKCGLLTPRELELTETHDAVSLLAQLSTGSISSFELTTAFAKRAAIAHQLTTCLTETLFPQALARAKDLDAHLATHKTPIGPLHGLPISVKDSFNITGLPSTIGYISFIGHGAATTTSALIEILLHLGAVLYVKTNIPQTLMTADSDNNVFGRTLNPHRLCLGAGGSSGGEGALLAMKGSPIGVGTDIAGSIRIPAYVNGTFGFRPSARRVPYGGQKGPGRAGSPWIVPVAGPLARSVRDIEMFMRAVLSTDTWTHDETVIALPWRSLPAPNPPAKTPLTLGVLLEESPSCYPLHPPVLRALRTATTHLQTAGHKILSLTPHLPATLLSTAMDLSFKGFLFDPRQTPFQHIQASGEPTVPSIPTAAPPEILAYKPSLDDVFEMNVQRGEISAAFRKAWVELGLDGVLMPTYQGTAVAHDRYGPPMYTVLANLLDYPAMTIPFLKAEQALDAEYRRDDVKYTPAYIPEQVEGMPTGIQLLGRPQKDEELVAMAPTVMAALGI